MNFIISIIVILTLYMIYKYICTPKNLTCEQYFNKKYPHVPTCTIKKCCKILTNKLIMEQLSKKPPSLGPNMELEYTNKQTQLLNGIIIGFEMYEKGVTEHKYDDDLCNFTIQMLNGEFDSILDEFYNNNDKLLN